MLQLRKKVFTVDSGVLAFQKLVGTSFASNQEIVLQKLVVVW
jgi:hypothetical protein